MLMKVAYEAPTWEQVRSLYRKLGQIGWEMVQRAMEIGDMLNDLKARTRQRSGEPSFAERCETHGIPHRTANTLMLQARNRPLLEQHKPTSQAKALKLIPPKARKPKAPLPIEKPTPQDYQNRFRVFVHETIHALENGYDARAPVTPDMLQSAHYCIELWERLAKQLEARL